MVWTEKKNKKNNANHLNRMCLRKVMHTAGELTYFILCAHAEVSGLSAPSRPAKGCLVVSQTLQSCLTNL